MWLFLRSGFYSIVRKPGDTDVLTVRARDRKDLESLRDAYLKGTEILTGGGTDYPYRMKVAADQLAAIVAAEVLTIDYSNFKDTQTAARHNVYMGVWSRLLELEPKGAWTLPGYARGRVALKRFMDYEYGKLELPPPHPRPSRGKRLKKPGPKKV